MAYKDFYENEVEPNEDYIAEKETVAQKHFDIAPKEKTETDDGEDFIDFITEHNRKEDAAKKSMLQNESESNIIKDEETEVDNNTPIQTENDNVAEKQQVKEKSKSAPADTNLVRIFDKADRIIYTSAPSGELYISDGIIVIKANQETLDYLVEKNNERNKTRGWKIEATEFITLSQKNKRDKKRLLKLQKIHIYSKAEKLKLYVFDFDDKYFGYNKNILMLSKS